MVTIDLKGKTYMPLPECTKAYQDAQSVTIVILIFYITAFQPVFWPILKKWFIALYQKYRKST
jgi:hypothetical protein